MVLHPDWNIANGHHTDVEFKPAIARYDWDQTYDVLEFVHLPQGFDTLMDKLGIPCFELMAIDRFTPYNYLWADQYSDYVYNFLKNFNFSPHNSLYRQEVKNYSAIPREVIPDSVVLNENFYSDFSEIKATFDKGIYSITCLIYQGEQGNIKFLDTINQCFYKFTIVENKEIDIKKILDTWIGTDDEELQTNKYCACSMVISKLENNTWIEYNPSFFDKPDWLLYADIGTYFNYQQARLLGYFDTNFGTYKKDSFNNSTLIYPLQGFIKEKQFNYSVKFEPISNDPNTLDAINLFVEENDKQGKVVFTTEKFPSYLIDFCYLQRANNNKWQTGNNYLDLGFTPIPKLDVQRNLVVNTFAVLSKGKPTFFTVENFVNLFNSDYNSQIDGTAVTFKRKKITSAWNNIPQTVFTFPDGSDIKLPEKQENVNALISFGIFSRDLEYLYSASSKVYLIDSFFSSNTSTSAILDEKIEFYCRKVTRNNIFAKPTKVLRPFENGESGSITFGSLDIYEFEYDFGYEEATSDTVTTQPPINIARKNRVMKDGIVIQDVTNIQTKTETYQMYQKDELVTASEWEEAYKGNTVVDDSNYLTYLLQLNEEWETQDRLNYEEEKNA